MNTNHHNRRDRRKFVSIPAEVVLNVKNGNALLAYAVLRLHADGYGNTIMSHATIARHMGFTSANTARKAVELLESVGAVTVTRRWGGPDGTVITGDSDDTHRARLAAHYRLNTVIDDDAEDQL